MAVGALPYRCVVTAQSLDGNSVLLLTVNVLDANGAVRQTGGVVSVEQAITMTAALDRYADSVAIADAGSKVALGAAMAATYQGTGVVSPVGGATVTTTRRTTNLTLSASASVSLGLSFPYAIGEVWVAQYRLFVTITGGTAGLKFKLNTLPAGVTGRFLVFGPTSGITAYTAGHAATLTTDSVAVLTGLVAGFVDLWVYVANGSAAGTIDLMVTTGLSAAGTIFTGSSVSQMRSQ